MDTRVLDIIYQDAFLLAVNKPSGLLSVPGLSSEHNQLNQVLQEFPNGRTLHRLDMSTSGLLLFALSYPMQKAMNQLFAQRLIKKHYTAVVAGIVRANSGEIEMPLICDWPNRPKQKIDWHDGKPAHTYFETLQRCNKFNHTRVALYPTTGRSHQLRLHCFGINHPILGDQLYNIDHSHDSAERLLLHATSVEFRHPFTQDVIRIECPPPF